MSIFGKRKNIEVDMTKGSIIKLIVMFALPLVAGNLFQQLYNTVDTWVVGKYATKEAFSAVGCVAPALNTYINFFVGLTNGAGVVIAQNFGAGDEKRVKESVSTTFIMSAVLCVAFTIISYLSIPFLLKLLNAPAEVSVEAELYLSIIFVFISFQLMYNTFASILRAVGDSKRPFLFLVTSCVTNIILDLVFVIQFHMGVAGVAWATIIAQGASAIMGFVTLLKTDSIVKLDFKNLVFNPAILKKILLVGIPTALQLSLTSFSNVIVQSYINYFGTDVMGGWTVYSKIDPLIFLVMNAFAMAITTFVGQNIGCGNIDRAKEGTKKTMFLTMGTSIVMCVIICIFAPQIAFFFNEDPAVIEYGVLFLRTQLPINFVCAVNIITFGALRGAGNSVAPMFIMLGSYVAFRQVYCYVVANFISNTILPISMSYPAGWLVCSLGAGIYYLLVGIDGKPLFAKKEHK